MSHKPSNALFQIIPTQAVSGNLTGPNPTTIFNKDTVGIQFVWTGTLNATFTVSVSNDYNPNTGTGTWTQLTLSTVPTASGSPGNAFVNLTQLGAAYINCGVAYASGSGNVTATLVAKGL